MTVTGFVRDQTGLWIEKSPEGDLSYIFDFNDPLDPWLALGEVLTAATFTIVDVGLTLVSQSHTTTTATVRLSGGTKGQKYKVKLAWTTANGADARVFTVRVNERSA